MCGRGARGRDWQRTKDAESAMDILDKHCVSGDIDQTEYEEKKRTLGDPIDLRTD